MQAEEKPLEIMRPLEIGTRIIYYSRDRCLNISAKVKASTLAFIWIVDEEESESREHFIWYSDIVQILPLV